MSRRFNFNLLRHHSVVSADIIGGTSAGKQLDVRREILARNELQDVWVESALRGSLEETDRKSSHSKFIICECIRCL